VEEFTRSLEKELDYTIEAVNIERMAAAFIKETDYYLPKVYKEFSTSKVITMEFIDGIKVSEVEKLDAAGLDRKIIIERGANFVFKQVFENGFFHADPHPGNIFILPKNVICMIDFGMVGSVDQETRDKFIELLIALVSKEPKKAMNVLLAMTDTDETPDRRLLERDVSDFMSAHLYKSLKDINVSKVTEEVLEIVSRHKLRIRPDIFLMMKAVTAVEGVARKLDPEFDMIQFAKPFAKKTLLTRLSPTRMATDFFTTATEFIHFFKQFPKEILELSQIAKKEKFVIRIELNYFEKMLSTFDKISNRIAFAIVIAALIVGSALIVMAKTPPMLYGISIVGIIGFLTAAIMGFWLLIAIITKGRL
jgi:ubiquinone biosynthesis protein